jgi:hypothetical protein
MEVLCQFFFEHKKGLRLKIGIGVLTGKMFSGILGSLRILELYLQTYHGIIFFKTIWIPIFAD